MFTFLALINLKHESALKALKVLFHRELTPPPPKKKRATITLICFWMHTHIYVMGCQCPVDSYKHDKPQGTLEM